MSSQDKSDDQTDDTFDSLCKEFEDDNTENVTVIENDNTENVTVNENLAEDAKKDETIREIDLFLEETIPLRTGDILARSACESSTPIRSSFLPRTRTTDSSDASAPRRRKSSGHSDLWTTIDRAVSSAGSDESRPIESNGNDSAANHSVILAGNLDEVHEEQNNEDELARQKLEEKKKEERKKLEEERRKLEEEKLDLSLLEKEQWEDEYEVTGFSVTDIMNEVCENDDLDITLLYEPDIESEEEEDKDSDNDITVVAVINNEEEEPKAKEKTKKERRANTTAIKDTKEWREELMKSKKQNKIKQKYYERAVSVWKKFTQGTDFTIPSIHEVNEPRIYKDQKGDIVGFDMPDEFIDNNHPVWQEHRDLYMRVMGGPGREEQFAKYIHNKWGWSNTIDLTRNLTNFPSLRDEPRNGATSKGQSAKGRGEKRNVTEKNADTTVTRKNVLEEMMAVVDEVGEVDEGELRLEIWRQNQENLKKIETNEVNLADSNNAKVSEDLPCGYCRKFCMCSPGHKKVARYVRGKRKKSSSVDKCNGETGAKIRKNDYVEDVAAAAARRSGGVERTAGILHSVGEVFTFNMMYHQGNENEPWLSEEQAQELNSLEDMYDIFKGHYSSPYARDNRGASQKRKTVADTEKSDAWEDLLEDI